MNPFTADDQIDLRSPLTTDPPWKTFTPEQAEDFIKKIQDIEIIWGTPPCQMFAEPKKGNTMNQPFFLVWNPQSGYTKYRHETEEAAAEEARRLAVLHPGKEFIVLRPVESVKFSKSEIVKYDSRQVINIDASGADPATIMRIADIIGHMKAGTEVNLDDGIPF